MASLFKKNHSATDPKTDKKVVKKSRKWWIKYRDADGFVRRVPGCTDKAATLQMAAKLERAAELKKAGVNDPYETHRKRPLSEHLDAYERFLKAKGTSPQHVFQVISRARKVMQGCRLVFYADMSPSKVQEYLADVKLKGRSPQTVNFYLQAIRQFVNWMVRDRRVPDNPLRVLSPLNVRKDRRHDRRAIEADELDRLVQSADEGRSVEGVDGPARGLLYLFSAFTGLRRKELASLTPRSLNLTAETPTVTVSAAYAKNGREDKIPLHPMLAQSIQRWVEVRGLGPTDFLFPLRTPGGDLRRTSKMIKRDLRSAREKWIKEAKTPKGQAEREKSDFLTYQDHDGLFADFHSARHTFVTNLGKAGVRPKLAQALARHSTINLTMNVYSHVGLDEKAQAVASIPAPANHQLDAQMQPPEDDEDEGGEGVTVSVPVVDPMPSGAQNGALILAWNGFDLVPVGTEGAIRGSEGLDLLPTPKSLFPEAFGPEWHPLAPNATAPQVAMAEVRPEGFEPPTLGSEDRCSIQLSYGRKLFYINYLQRWHVSGKRLLANPFFRPGQQCIRHCRALVYGCQAALQSGQVGASVLETDALLDLCINMLSVEQLLLLRAAGFHTLVVTRQEIFSIEKRLKRLHARSSSATSKRDCGFSEFLSTHSNRLSRRNTTLPKTLGLR